MSESESSGYRVDVHDRNPGGRADVTLTVTGGSIEQGDRIEVVILEQFGELRVHASGYEDFGEESEQEGFIFMSTDDLSAPLREGLVDYLESRNLHKRYPEEVDKLRVEDAIPVEELGTELNHSSVETKAGSL